MAAAASICGRLSGLTCRRSVGFMSSRWAHTVEKEPLKATVTFIADDQSTEEGSTDMPPYVTRYSSRGFRVKNVKVFGSVAIVPQDFYHWKIVDPGDITPESLSLFTLMDPPIEILVVGTGDKIVRLSPEVLKHMKQKNIMLEVQDTRNAAATFNFLLEEDRLVGAALIPPRSDN